MSYGILKTEASVGPAYNSAADAAPITELENLLNQLDQVTAFVTEDLNGLEKTLAPYLRPSSTVSSNSKGTSDPEPVRSPLEHALAAMLNRLRRIDQDLLELKSRL